jgi:ketosteroid isomerase-like protein
MNDAEKLLKKIFRFGEGPVDAIGGSGMDPTTFFHPNVVNSLFGPSGTKELIVGRDAFFEFVGLCTSAVTDRSDEIIAITGIDKECALVHARAKRKSVANGQEIEYEWAMLYRVEDGFITYGADMLDTDAQAFWGNVLRSN